MNLEFLGLGPRGGAVDYQVAARGGVAGGSYRIGTHPLWVGLRYARVDTSVTLDDADRPSVPTGDFELAKLQLQYFHPLADSVYFGIRAAATRA